MIVFALGFVAGCVTMLGLAIAVAKDWRIR
jgi:hypothetical protein